MKSTRLFTVILPAVVLGSFGCATSERSIVYVAKLPKSQIDYSTKTIMGYTFDGMNPSPVKFILGDNDIIIIGGRINETELERKASDRVKALDALQMQFTEYSLSAGLRERERIDAMREAELLQHNLGLVVIALKSARTPKAYEDACKWSGPMWSVDEWKRLMHSEKVTK